MNERTIETVARRRRRGKKRKKSHFYDQAMDGYIRETALDKWKEVLDLEEVNNISLAEAADSAGHFPERGQYLAIWRKQWVETLAGLPDGMERTLLLEKIETAVRGSFEEEIAAREAEGARPIADTLDFKGFNDRAMEHLLQEADGEIEEDLD